MVGGEVSENQHHQPSGSNWSRVHVLVGSMLLTSPTWWGFQYLQNSSKILLRISHEGEPGPYPKAALSFLDCSLSLHPLPSLISNCLNLPFGTQGRSWRLESVPYKQEMGDTERLTWCPGAPQGPAWFHLGIQGPFSLDSSLCLFSLSLQVLGW